MIHTRAPHFIHALTLEEEAAIRAANCTTKHVLSLAGESEDAINKALHTDIAHIVGRASAVCAYEAMRTAKAIDWLVANSGLKDRPRISFVVTLPDADLSADELFLWDPDDYELGLFPAWKRARTRLTRMGIRDHGIASVSLRRLTNERGREVYRPVMRGVLWAAIETQVTDAFAPGPYGLVQAVDVVTVVGNVGGFIADWKPPNFRDFEWYAEMSRWSPASLMRTDRSGMDVLRSPGYAELRPPMSPERRALLAELLAEAATHDLCGRS